MNIIKDYTLIVIGMLIGMGLLYWVEELCK
jgi:preprotein translocase subunit SecE